MKNQSDIYLKEGVKRKRRKSIDKEEEEYIWLDQISWNQVSNGGKNLINNNSACVAHGVCVCVKSIREYFQLFFHTFGSFFKKPFFNGGHIEILIQSERWMESNQASDK